MSASVETPGEVDSRLNEFWVGNPWKIFQEHNLSCFERNRLYMNVRGRGFLDVSHVSGADNDGDSRSAIAADVNHDGRLDLILRQSGGGPLVVYENQVPSGHYLEVNLKATRGHPSAIGARVIARFGGRQVVRECYPQNALRSQAPLPIHLGLGESETVEELEIHWPSGQVETFRELAGDRRITVTQGQPLAQHASDTGTP